MLEVSGTIGLAHVVLQSRAFSLESTPVLLLDRFSALALDLLERLPGQCINVPRLQIAVRCRAGRAFDQLTDVVRIDWLVEEPTARDTRVDRFKDVHR